MTKQIVVYISVLHLWENTFVIPGRSTLSDGFLCDLKCVKGASVCTGIYLLTFRVITFLSSLFLKYNVYGCIFKF